MMQIGSEKELLLALLEDVQAKHAEVATFQAQQELTLKAVALATSERDAALRQIGPGNANLAEARALADSKPHLIRARIFPLCVHQHFAGAPAVLCVFCQFLRVLRPSRTCLMVDVCVSSVQTMRLHTSAAEALSRQKTPCQQDHHSHNGFRYLQCQCHRPRAASAWKQSVLSDTCSVVQELQLELDAADEQYHSLHTVRKLLREQNHILGKQRQVRRPALHIACLCCRRPSRA